jgi:hypothetical protein
MCTPAVLLRAGRHRAGDRALCPEFPVSGNQFQMLLKVLTGFIAV